MPIIVTIGEVPEEHIDEMFSAVLVRRRKALGAVPVRPKVVNVSPSEFYARCSNVLANSDQISMTEAFGNPKVIAVICDDLGAQKLSSFDNEICWPGQAPLVGKPGGDGHLIID